MTELAEIIKLMRETGEYSLVEKIIQKNGNLNEVKMELRKHLIEEPLEKLQTLSNLSDIKNALKILDEKLGQEKTGRMVEQYLERAEFIGREGEKKYHWQEYTDQLVILVEIGNFSQETTDMLLLKHLDRHYSTREVSTNGQMLELLRKLMPMASENARETLHDWYFRGIVEKKVPGGYWGGHEDIEEVEVDRETVVIETNKTYDKIIFKRSCVVSGSLTAMEIEAENNLVIFGDLTVKRKMEIKGNLTVTGKLGGGGYRPSSWRGNFRNSSEYTGHFKIGKNLIADTVETYSSLAVRGDIKSRNVAVPREVRAKNIFTPGVLSVYSDLQNTVKAKKRIVADSVLVNTDNSRSQVEAKTIECFNTLEAPNVKANEIRANKIENSLGNPLDPKKLQVDSIVRPDIRQNRS